MGEAERQQESGAAGQCGRVRQRDGGIAGQLGS